MKLVQLSPMRHLLAAWYFSPTAHAQAVHVLARFLANPRRSHWLAAKRVLRYLKGTVDWGLLFGGRNKSAVEAVGETELCPSRLVGWCDADHGGCLDSRESTSGRVFTLNGAAVSWESCKQPTVSTSTTEAEFIGAADDCKEALWLRNLLHDFGFQQKTMDMFSHSTCALALIRNLMHHSRAKHIGVQHKFVRDCAARGEVRCYSLPKY
jgi:hypothetical protein